MIRYKTTSSPEASLASNLQCDTVLLSSASAASSSFLFSCTKPVVKNVWMDDKAAEVIGPVDRGDRIMAKNGANKVERGMSSMSLFKVRVSMLLVERCFRAYYLYF